MAVHIWATYKGYIAEEGQFQDDDEGRPDVDDDDMIKLEAEMTKGDEAQGNGDDE